VTALAAHKVDAMRTGFSRWASYAYATKPMQKRKITGDTATKLEDREQASTHHHQDTSHFLGDHLSPGYQLSPDSRRLSAHEQRSEMARAVAEEDAAAAQQELEEVKKRAAEQEAETNKGEGCRSGLQG
jgi:chromosome condensin MukBEF ATPase and DNA-binding subunit MukB